MVYIKVIFWHKERVDKVFVQKKIEFFFQNTEDVMRLNFYNLE